MTTAKTKTGASDAAPAFGGPGRLLTASIWMLLFARWFVPAEAVYEGDTLWLAVLTFLVAACWAWMQSVQVPSHIFRDRWDRAVWLLVIAHVASACAVVATTGQKRYSLNLVWEWTAVGLQFLLLRQSLTSPVRRNSFIRSVIVLGTSLSLYGIWQQFVWYPENTERYLEIRARLDAWEQIRPKTADEGREQREGIQKLRAELIAIGAPLVEPARGLFERRLRDSKEPMGFFALANNLGGILATMVALWAGTWSTQTSPFARKGLRFAVLGGGTAIVAACLLLTKSRTAWCGTLAGLSLFAVLTLSSRAGMTRRIALIGGGVAVAAGVLVLLAMALGGLDREVWSEAPKSLRYRLEYWAATLDIIAEHPWLGVGPGNFRSHYLIHKLPQASEEVADPHQFLLEVTANAGILGAIGMLYLLLLFAQHLWRVGVAERRTSTESHSESCKGKDVPPAAAEPGAAYLGTWAIGLTGLLVAGQQWFFYGEPSNHVVCVAAIAIGVTFILDRLAPLQDSVREFPIGAVFSAALTLLVHLLGAGGIGIPAILNWLLALFALVSLMDRPLTIPKPLPPRFFQVAALGYVGLCLAAAKLAMLPVLLAKSHVIAGEIEFSAEGKPDRARTAFVAANEHDPLSPEPLRRLSELAMSDWEDSGNESAFRQAIEYAEAAWSRDPLNALVPSEIAQLYMRHFERTNAREDVELAVKWFEMALGRYPTHPLWNARYALALRLTGRGQDAKRAAEYALHLEDLNRRARHRDRYLPEDIANSMRKLAGN